MVTLYLSTIEFKSVIYLAKKDDKRLILLIAFFPPIRDNIIIVNSAGHDNHEVLLSNDQLFSTFNKCSGCILFSFFA